MTINLFDPQVSLLEIKKIKCVQNRVVVHILTHDDSVTCLSCPLKQISLVTLFIDEKVIPQPLEVGLLRSFFTRDSPLIPIHDCLIVRLVQIDEWFEHFNLVLHSNYSVLRPVPTHTIVEQVFPLFLLVLQLEFVLSKLSLLLELTLHHLC